MNSTFYKLIFYVPKENKEEVKSSLFEIGLGKLGNYENCAFESVGTGQFTPKTGSNPTIGSQGQLTRVEEYRVEILCPKNLIDKAISKLKNVHPYEEPAYEFYEVFQ